MFSATGIAAYPHTEKMPDWREEEPLTDTPEHQTEGDMRVQLATQAGDLKSLSREVVSIRTSVEKEIGRMAAALEKHADIVTRAVDSIKAEFVTRAEIAALVERVKKLELVVFGAVGMIVVAVFGALIGLVVMK